MESLSLSMQIHSSIGILYPCMIHDTQLFLEHLLDLLHLLPAQITLPEIPLLNLSVYYPVNERSYTLFRIFTETSTASAIIRRAVSFERGLGPG